MLLSIEVRSSGVDATPFTVEVRVVPDSPNVLVLMIGTVLPVTPFTVVDKVLALEVLLTPDTADDVAAMPLTVEVRVFVDKESVLVVAAPSTEAGVTLTQFVPLYWSRLLETRDEMATPVPCILATLLPASVPVTSPDSERLDSD